MDIETMIAREAIRETLALYNNAGDRGAIDEMMRCFTDDAELHVDRYGAVGVDAIRTYLDQIRSSGMLSGPDAKPARHHISTSRIDFIDRANANGWTYFQLVRSGAIIQHGIYVDRFRAVDGRWLLTYRRVKVEYDGLDIFPN